MNTTALHWPGRSWLAVTAAALLTGCADRSPVGPEGGPSFATSSAGAQAPDLGSCGNLQVEAGNKLAYQVYAKGVQIYHWNGAGWTFNGPLAVLSADPAGNSVVGTHYSGPTWESVSGSFVKGTIVQRCTPDPDDIQWLLLKADTSAGPGIFDGVTFIQRVSTAGGVAPAYAGSVIGEEARVPYTTEYLFYRPQ